MYGSDWVGVGLFLVVLVFVGGLIGGMIHETRSDNAAVVACVEAGANPLECAKAVD